MKKKTIDLIKNKIKNLHEEIRLQKHDELLIINLLRAVEKQMPMPLKIHAELLFFCHSNGSRYVLNCKTYFCQSCNSKIMKLTSDKIEYCPYCGQRLWWPKN